MYGEYRPDGSHFLNYDLIRDHLLTWPTMPHVDTLEELSKEIFDVAFSIDIVFACWVRLVKPHIFPEAQGAGIEVFRWRD